MGSTVRRRLQAVLACPGRASDAGTAILEFVMITVLLIFLLFGVLQVAATLYVRNVVAASVADAAHYMALRGVSASEGAQRASDLIARGLSPRMSADLPCIGSVGTDAASGLPVAQVECSGRIKSIFLPAMSFVSIHVVSHALKEIALKEIALKGAAVKGAAVKGAAVKETAVSGAAVKGAASEGAAVKEVR